MRTVYHEWKSKDAEKLYQMLADEVKRMALALRIPETPREAQRVHRDHQKAIEPYIKEMARIHSLFCFPIISMPAPQKEGAESV